MIKKRLLLLIGAVLLLAQSVSAEYSPALNASDVVNQNQTYIISTSGYTPFPFWAFVTFLGIGLLLMSFVLKPDQGNDVFALLAPIPIVVSAWQATSVEIITSSGMGALTLSDGTSKYVMLENHTVFPQMPIAIMMAIFFVISLLNIYRVLIVVPRLQAPMEAPPDGE